MDGGPDPDCLVLSRSFILFCWRLHFDWRLFTGCVSTLLLSVKDIMPVSDCPVLVVLVGLSWLGLGVRTENGQNEGKDVSQSQAE